MIAKTDVREAIPTPSRAAEPRIVRDETGPCNCAHCGKPLPPPKATGRSRRTCSHSCRNAAYTRRARGLPEDLPRMPRRGRRPLAGLLADSKTDKRGGT